jgi:hypothetical protein
LPRNYDHRSMSNRLLQTLSSSKKYPLSRAFLPCLKSPYSLPNCVQF